MGKLSSDQEALLARAKAEMAEMLRSMQVSHSSEVRRARRVLQLLDEIEKDV
jgi:hypothetical protein